MHLDYERILPKGPSVVRRFCLVTIGGGLVGFIVWCGIDLVLVRHSPSHLLDFNWLMFFFPAAIVGVGIVLLKPADPTPLGPLAVLAATLASIIAALLILFLGIHFHLSIGGRFEDCYLKMRRVRSDPALRRDVSS